MSKSKIVEYYSNYNWNEKHVLRDNCINVPVGNVLHCGKYFEVSLYPEHNSIAFLGYVGKGVNTHAGQFICAASELYSPSDLRVTIISLDGSGYNDFVDNACAPILDCIDEVVINPPEDELLLCVERLLSESDNRTRIVVFYGAHMFYGRTAEFLSMQNHIERLMRKDNIIPVMVSCRTSDELEGYLNKFTYILNHTSPAARDVVVHTDDFSRSLEITCPAVTVRDCVLTSSGSVCNFETFLEKSGQCPTEHISVNPTILIHANSTYSKRRTIIGYLNTLSAIGGSSNTHYIELSKLQRLMERTEGDIIPWREVLCLPVKKEGL